MKYFAEKRRAVNYIIPELIATLQDDINNQKANGEPERDYIELEDKIKDIEEVQPVMEAAPGLLEALKVAYEVIEGEYPEDDEIAAPVLEKMKQAINTAEGNT